MNNTPTTPTPTPRTNWHLEAQAQDAFYSNATLDSTNAICVKAVRDIERDLSGFLAVLGHPITADDTAESASSKVVLAITALQAMKREVDALKEKLTAALDARKTAEQELEKNRTSFKICCGAAGVADESELCGAIDRMKQRAEDAEKACAHLRQEVFETRCFDLKGACSAAGHGKRDEEIVAIVNERLSDEIQNAGQDYIPKSKLDEAIKALNKCLYVLKENHFSHCEVYSTTEPYCSCGFQQEYDEALAAAEKVTIKSLPDAPSTGRMLSTQEIDEAIEAGGKRTLEQLRAVEKETKGEA